MTTKQHKDLEPTSIYGVECWDHGNQGLTRQEYGRQMNRPDALWTCPICGTEATWDDDRYERGIEAAHYEESGNNSGLTASEEMQKRDNYDWGQ